MYGEEIINRLHPESELHNPDNPARKIIENTIGAWLDNFDYTKVWEGLFLQTAEGPYLDLHGNDYNVLRKLNESDEDYRKRIVYETLLHLTIDYLHDVYGVKTYVAADNFNPVTNGLTSDNPYIQGKGLMIVADDSVRKIIQKKFVYGSEIKWLTP